MPDPTLEQNVEGIGAGFAALASSGMFGPIAQAGATGAVLGANAGNATVTAVSNALPSITVSRLATIIIGLIVFTSGIFIFGRNYDVIP